MVGIGVCWVRNRWNCLRIYRLAFEFTRGRVGFWRPMECDRSFERDFAAPNPAHAISRAIEIRSAA